MYRYYLLMRGPGPGCQPKIAMNIHDFGGKKDIGFMGYRAWGYVEYKEKLTRLQKQEYELLEVKL